MNVALNISNKNIKILSLAGKKVKKWASAELPPGLVRDGLILDPKKVGEAVGALFKKTGMSKDQVVSSVAGWSFTYRFIKLPPLKAEQQEEAILRAARREISIPLDDLYISWQRLPDTGGEMSYFVLGIERNRIDALVDTLKAAGIEPYLAGLRPLSLARVAEHSDAIIVSIEESTFDFVIMSGGIPRVIHSINTRESNVTLEDNINRLADELTKTAAFYQSSNPGAPLNKDTPLLITGDWAAEPTTSALLQTEVEYPVSRLTPRVEIPPDFPVDAFTTCIGLALKKNPASTASRKEGSNLVDVNVNVLAGKYRKPKAKPVPATRILAWTLLAVMVILIYPLYRGWTDAKTSNDALATQVMDMQRQIKIAKSINQDANTIKGQINETLAAADNVTAAYQATLGQPDRYTKVLDTAVSLIPEGILFSSIEINGNVITISGEAGNASDVITYAAALEKTGDFQTVRIQNLADAGSEFVTAGPPDNPVPAEVIVFSIVLLN